ncbi:MAG: hypothetical protein JJ939_15860 [Alphaproteobacteria bacterium]|nr:hypothetical protein [Alphaproteobacteria bacterium]
MRADDPRIEKLIKSESFHHFPGTNIVVCAVVMTCGQQSVGWSFAPGGMDFDFEAEKERARKKTRRNIAGLESYRERAERSAA